MSETFVGECNGWIRALSNDCIEYICADGVGSITLGSLRGGADHLVQIHTRGRTIELLAASREDEEEKVFRIIKLLSTVSASKWSFGYNPNSYSKVVLPDGTIICAEQLAWAALEGHGGITRWEIHISKNDSFRGGGDGATVLAFNSQERIVTARRFPMILDGCYIRQLGRTVALAVAFVRKSLPEFPDIPEIKP